MQGCAGRYSARCKWAGQAPSTGNRLWPTSETTAIGAHLVTLTLHLAGRSGCYDLTSQAEMQCI